MGSCTWTLIAVAQRPSPRLCKEAVVWEHTQKSPQKHFKGPMCKSKTWIHLQSKSLEETLGGSRTLLEESPSLGPETAGSSVYIPTPLLPFPDLAWLSFLPVAQASCPWMSSLKVPVVTSGWWRCCRWIWTPVAGSLSRGGKVPCSEGSEALGALQDSRLTSFPEQGEGPWFNLLMPTLILAWTSWHPLAGGGAEWGRAGVISLTWPTGLVH